MSDKTTETIFREEVDFSVVETKIVEEQLSEEQLAEGKKPKKKYTIKGPMLEGDVRNQNGRTYPIPILIREAEKFMEGKIKDNRALGELGHPSTTEINLDRVSHLIESFEVKDNIVLGTAVILDTPMGKIAKSLIDEGVKLGVSSRGVGTMKNSVVQPDFRLITVDIVSEPSAPSAFVDGIVESKKEWVMEKGILVEKQVEEIEKEIEKIEVHTPAQLEEAMHKIMTSFLKKVRENMDAK
jgi:hypothetical protein